MNQWDVIVIGGGAAGLMCAATAGRRGRKVLVIDHANKVGKKILMSGGGRCNFTNLYVEPSNYLSHNPHFCKSALSRFTQWDFLEMVNRHGIAYHEKTQGQLFCDNKANDILQMLLTECENAGVTIQTRCSVDTVKQDGQFVVATSDGSYQSESLVVATGGLSIPTMGATGLGYQLAKQFGLDVLETTASLVPFTLSGKWQERISSLSGIALPVAVSTPRKSFTDALLFTHRGLSGPAVLQASNYWFLGEPISIDFIPGYDFSEQVQQWQKDSPKQELKTLLSTILPKRFVLAWLDEAYSTKPIAQYSKAEVSKLAGLFHQWQVTPSGTEGYRTAEVTRGGVNTDAISSKTFEAKGVKGLYFIGEVLDVTGWLGGYNFQWAWASGYCAGQYV